MKFLITGSSGFVGKHLKVLLEQSGHEVYGIGKGSNQASIDLTKASLVENISFSQFDGIFHLAGLAAVGPSFKDPKKYLRVNSEIEINIFETILKQACSPRVIIVSSGGIYDPKELPVNENSPLLPANPYAVSKITQEFLAQYYIRKGLDVIIARPFNHCGPGQSEGFLVADLAKQITSAEKNHIEVVVGDLSSKRDYTDVRDITKGYLALMQKGRSGEIYNVCSGVARSGNDILKSMLQQSQEKIKVRIDRSLFRAAEHKEVFGSYEKINRHTSWKPEIPFERTLKDTLEYWRSLS